VVVRDLASLDGVEVLYLSSRVEFGMRPDRLGNFLPSPLTMPVRSLCRVFGSTVTFERPGLSEEIDMATSRAEVERRYLAWSVCFPILNGHHVHRPHRRFFRSIERPRISGFDPRVIFLAVVLGVIGLGQPVLLLGALPLLAGCIYQSRSRALQIGMFLNDLSPLEPAPRRKRSGSKKGPTPKGHR
jgi:hypothetical protein